MNQTTKLSMQKGGISGTENTETRPVPDVNEMDTMIDVAVTKWVLSHPKQMERFNDSSYTKGLFRNSKVIYL